MFHDETVTCPECSKVCGPNDLGHFCYGCGACKDKNTGSEVHYDEECDTVVFEEPCEKCGWYIPPWEPQDDDHSPILAIWCFCCGDVIVGGVRNECSCGETTAHMRGDILEFCGGNGIPIEIDRDSLERGTDRVCSPRSKKYGKVRMRAVNKEHPLFKRLEESEELEEV